MPPGSQTGVWVSVSWETFSAIIVKWNWPRKQTRSLSISPSSPDRACLADGFLLFSLFVCLLVWSGTLGYPAWCVEEQQWDGGRGGMDEVRPVGGRGGGGCATRRPPREVTRDLPRSYRPKLLDKYTQAPGSGQQRGMAVSDPAAEGFI